MGLRMRVKGWLEKASGNLVWIGPATPREKVLEVIERLRPRHSSRGLVRVGPETDGGYLMPDDLDGVIAAVSPGVSTESRFDQALADRGIDIYMADASVDAPALQHPRFHFDKVFLGPVTQGNTITIDDFCAKIPGFQDGGDLILQMDIEGAEYPVLHSISSPLLSRFRIIIIELHGLEHLFQPFAYDFIKPAIDRLLEHHEVVHLHPNNCCGADNSQGIEIPRAIEVTLYRRDRATFTRRADLVFPHPLDADNVPQNTPLVLPPLWR